VDPYLAQATGKLTGITGRDQGGGQPTHWTIPGHMDRRDEIRRLCTYQRCVGAAIGRSGYMDLY